MLEAALELAGFLVMLFGDVELYGDAGVEDQLPWLVTFAQTRESRTALTISVESEKVRPEAASRSENSRALLAQRLGSPVALLEGFILVFLSVTGCTPLGLLLWSDLRGELRRHDIAPHRRSSYRATGKSEATSMTSGGFFVRSSGSSYSPASQRHRNSSPEIPR